MWGGNRKFYEIRVALSVFHLFDPCGHYGRFFYVTDRSDRAVTVTGELIWTDLLHH